MIQRVRKAVFPAAGLGTRFLPATKAMPKEMLPLVDKPLIQYGVEEAMHSGAQNIIIVTGRGKSSIEDHFDVSFEMEHLLSSRNKKELLQIVRGVSEMIDVAYVRQKEALGLGHAVLRAKDLVANEPFAVVLSDDVIDAGVPCLRQLLDIYEFYNASVVALMEVPKDQISAYGVVDAEPITHEPRHHWTLCPDAGNLPLYRSRRTRQRRRDPVDRWIEASAAQPTDLRIQVRGHTLRRRRQAWLPQGHRRIRAETPRSGRRLPRVS
jgi:UTP-glucose-1-phosphate uridylyltransferase